MIESTGRFWETVYNRNIRKWIGICYRYTANRQLSEDLAHDAFLKAIDKSASFEGKGCFEAWMRRIVVNHVLQHLRDQKRRKHLDDWLRHESTVVHTEDNNLNTNPSEQLEFSEEELLDAINNLPEHHRLVFNLYVIDNFTHAQIGEELGISSGTSKSHLARARKKIRQLLIEKDNKKRDRKKGILLLFLSNKFRSIDQLYREQFNNFGIPPEKALSPDFSKAPIPTVKPQQAAFTSLNYIIAATSLGIIITAAFIVFNLYQQQNDIDTIGIEHAQSAIQNEDKNPVLGQKSKKETDEEKTTDDSEYNSPGAASIAATIFPNSVISIKNIKDKRMKNLDSLGIMLLMSSSIIFDTTAQSKHKTDIQASTETQALAMKDQPIESVNSIESSSAIDVKKSKKEKGTFYASSLFWSGTNHELYLKGVVRVEIGDNNFKGDGTFNFLGPVYLLIVNDKPVELDSKIKLSQQQYQLTRLSNREAIEKYGEKGQQGAVEINVIE